MPQLLSEQEKTGAQKTGWFEVLPAELLTVADRTSGQFNNPYAQGMILTIVVANETGSFSATPKLQIVNAYGTALTFWTAASAITANGTFNYLFYPVTITNTAFNETVAFPIPGSWRLFLDYTGTASDKADTKASACYI
jgi:hypothetical protein